MTNQQQSAFTSSSDTASSFASSDASNAISNIDRSAEYHFFVETVFLIKKHTAGPDIIGTARLYEFSDQVGFGIYHLTSKKGISRDLRIYSLYVCPMTFTGGDHEYDNLVKQLLKGVCKKGDAVQHALALGWKAKAVKLTDVSIFWEMHGFKSTLTGASSETIGVLLNKMKSRNGNDRIRMWFELV